VRNLFFTRCDAGRRGVELVAMKCWAVVKGGITWGNDHGFGFGFGG
jgi:hypothetical protein